MISVEKLIKRLSPYIGNEVHEADVTDIFTYLDVNRKYVFTVGVFDTYFKGWDVYIDIIKKDQPDVIVSYNETPNYDALIQETQFMNYLSHHMGRNNKTIPLLDCFSPELLQAIKLNKIKIKSQHQDLY